MNISNPYDDITLPFTLKQHTPIIHFQHYQDGATLRATEVKSKLDTFIMEQICAPLKGEAAREAFAHQHPEWLVGKGKAEQVALDYKMVFKPRNKQDVKLNAEYDPNKRLYFTNPKMPPLVLANMGGQQEENDLKNYSLYEFIDVIIISVNTELLNGIRLHIALFWAIHNFGNRQNKGFGSFYPAKEDKIYKDPKNLIQEHYKTLVYWEYQKDQKFKNIFEDIEIVSRIMKSGINFPDRRNQNLLDCYQPSFLKNYFLEKYKIGSDKRHIKESLFRRDVRIAKDPNLKENNYIRSILGVSDFFEFLDNDRKGKVNIKSSTVERFKSPLTYKVFLDKVFIIVGDWTPIRGHHFEFSTDRDRSNPISTPSVNFNFEIFLEEFSSYFNSMAGSELDRLYDLIQAHRVRDKDIPKIVNQYMNCLDSVIMSISKQKSKS